MRPLLLNYLTPRIQSNKNVDFTYDAQSGLNYIKTIGDITIPVIDIDLSKMLLDTLTEVANESSNDDWEANCQTETKVAIEGSDSCFDFMLATKTFSNVESDDECTYNN